MLQSSFAQDRCSYLSHDVHVVGGTLIFACDHVVNVLVVDESYESGHDIFESTYLSIGHVHNFQASSGFIRLPHLPSRAGERWIRWIHAQAKKMNSAVCWCHDVRLMYTLYTIIYRNWWIFQEPAAQKALVGLQSILLPFVVPMILMCLGRLGLLPIFMATWRVQAVRYPSAFPNGPCGCRTPLLLL